MLPQRTWSVQLNLDELNAAWMVLREPVEKADFLDGMTHGLNLAGRPGQESPAYASGFNLGHQSRTATEEYREQQSKNGKLGGRPKKTAALAPLNRRFAGAERRQPRRLRLLRVRQGLTLPLPRLGWGFLRLAAWGRGRRSLE